MRSARNIKPHGHAAHMRRMRVQRRATSQRKEPAVRRVVVGVDVESPPRRTKTIPVRARNVSLFGYYWILE